MLENILIIVEKCSLISKELQKYRINPEMFDADNTLLISDNNDIIQKGRQAGIACIGVESRGRISDADYVAERLENIDSAYAKLVYSRHHRLPLTIAETDRLLIREITEQDVKELYKVYEDPDITRYMEGLYEYEEELEFTRHYIDNMYRFYGYGLWVVFEKNSNVLIGRAGISNRMVDATEYPELGYVIRKEYQRKGYAYEACEAVLAYAGNQLEMEEILVCTHKENLPSIHLAVKLGFHYCCEADENMLIYRKRIV